jgi:potassium-dependent mechanosensitive channel
MKVIFLSLLVLTVLLNPNSLVGQGVIPTNSDNSDRRDTVVVEDVAYYKTAEIAYEIENSNRFIRTSQKQIDSYDQIREIDSSFDQLSAHLIKEYEEFETFNKQNLSKFFLLNTKKVWLSYRSQLMSWQDHISERIESLMQMSDRIKENEQLWKSTLDRTESDRFSDDINERISNTITDLNKLETRLFDVVSKLSELESRIRDQVIELDQHISIIDELDKYYRSTLFKANQPALWNLDFKGSYEGTVRERLKKAWYENTKSMKDTLPLVAEYFGRFITWCIIIIAFILLIRFLYIRKLPEKYVPDQKNINKLIIVFPWLSIIYMVLFVFGILFNNIPLALSDILALTLLIITYYLLRPYIPSFGRRLIFSFLILLIANSLEIVFWYFGNYARIYLMLEAILGLILVWPLVNDEFKQRVIREARYPSAILVLRYPVFSSFAVAFVVNMFGYQNLTVLLLKIAIQISVSVIIIIAAWELGRSSVFNLLEVLKHYKKTDRFDFLPQLQKRLTWLINLFFILIWLHISLVITELDTPFYAFIDNLLYAERNVGSFVYTYSAIFQFIIIILITWGLTSLVKIIFDEDNFKRTQRLRGIPSAISTTLRLIFALAGFLLAMSAAGIDLTKISILLGAFGVGIGFGLQNIVNNFISGLILIYERPIKVGDTIELNNLLGEVKSIGIRSSNVRTFDGAEVVVPNSLLVSDQLINWTLSDEKRRIEIVVGVKYGTDPTQVIQILKSVAEDHPLVVKNPAPRVLFNEFADSSLNFRLLCWVLFEHGIQTKSDLSVAIDTAFKENSIEIPFPQMDLHVIETPGDKKSKKESIRKPEDDDPLIAGGSGLDTE